MADVQIAVIDDTENVVNVAVPGIQGPIGTTGSVTIAQAGTAATPGIRFESDTNTGIYSPGADQLAVSTGGTGRLFIDSSGRVGIGTSSPDSVLSINGASALGALGSGAPAITLKNTDTTNFNAAQIVNRDSGGNIACGISFRNLSHGASGNSDLIFHIRNAGTVRESLAIGATGTTTLNAAASTAPFIAQINSSEAARIDSSGRLLVGTSTGVSAAFVNSSIQAHGLSGDASSVTLYRFTTSATAAATSRLVMVRSGSDSKDFTVVANGNRLGQFIFAGADGAQFVNAASIDCEVDGTPGASDMPGRLVFSTTSDGGSTPTERLRITSAGVLQVADAGNIQVGTTTGTKIGTATTQKLGFYNATPVVQPTAVADATDAASVITQLNALLTRMRNLGLIAT